MLMLQNEQADRIESKLDRLLALLDKPKAAKRSQKESPYVAEFEELWALYPRRVGSNPKKDAYHAFNARINAGETFSVLREGVVTYRAYCDATGITGSSFVMQAVRFFGPNQEYLNDWTPPTPKAPTPRTDEEWLALGKQKGIEPRTGETWREFIDRLRSSV